MPQQSAFFVGSLLLWSLSYSTFLMIEQFPVQVMQVEICSLISSNLQVKSAGIQTPKVLFFKSHP